MYEGNYLLFVYLLILGGQHWSFYADMMILHCTNTKNERVKTQLQGMLSLCQYWISISDIIALIELLWETLLPWPHWNQPVTLFYGVWGTHFCALAHRATECPPPHSPGKISTVIHFKRLSLFNPEGWPPRIRGSVVFNIRHPNVSACSDKIDCRFILVDITQVFSLKKKVGWFRCSQLQWSGEQDALESVSCAGAPHVNVTCHLCKGPYFRPGKLCDRGSRFKHTLQIAWRVDVGFSEVIAWC